MVRLSLDDARERVRPRRDRLRLERLLRPAEGHLVRDHALDVAVELYDVDHAHEAVHRVELERSPERRPVQRQQPPRGGADDQGRAPADETVGALEAEVRPDRDRALLELVRLPVRAADRERHRGRDRDGGATLGDEDLHRAQWRLPERRARVVVREDLVVRLPLERLAVGAPLAHADAVAPAASGHDEQRLTGGGRGLRRGRRGYERDHGRKNDRDSHEEVPG